MRYSRQTAITGFGEEAQQRLAASAALIVGLGGLGAPVATYLTSSGVGRIGLCDNDRVSLSNLQRQTLYTEHDLDHPKTLCAASRLQALSSSTVFDIHSDGLTAENAATLIAGYDIVVDCTDNFAARVLIDRVCHAAGKPWVHGSLDGMSGCVTVFNHLRHKRYTDLYPDATTLTDSPSRLIPTLGPVPGVIGSLQAIEAIKVLSGFGVPLDGQLMMLDLYDMTSQTIDF